MTKSVTPERQDGEVGTTQAFHLDRTQLEILTTRTLNG